MYQFVENIPCEIKESARFFSVGNDKVPREKRWQNPDNQRQVAQVAGLKGFDTCGHDRGDDYLLIDFDHVLDDSGEFIYPDAKRWYNLISQMSDNIYCERSISGHGLHILVAPTSGKFSKVTNAKKNVISFDETTGAKIELFYLNKARYCLLTGNLFGCKPNASIPHGEIADKIFQCLLDEIEAKKSSQLVTKKKKTPPIKNDSVEYDLFRAEIMLNYIVPSDLGDTDWLAVISACKNVGIDYKVVDAWCRLDETKNDKGELRYNENENKTRWDSLNDPSFDIRTLHGKAKTFGYLEDKARRQWHDLHPELKASTVENPNGETDVGGKQPKTSTKNTKLSPQEQQKNAQQKNQSRDISVQKIQRLREQYAKNPSKELAKKITTAIIESCDVNRDSITGLIINLRKTAFNADMIFSYDPILDGLIGHDDFQQADVFLKTPPWREDNCIGEKVRDSDIAEIRTYLRRSYLDFASKSLIDDWITSYSNKNRFHAVRNYLNNLPAWDNVPRAETLFIKFLCVKDTPFAREVTMNWLIAALARIFYPGCRYQTALILHGAQGIGKSYIIESLGGKWYSAIIDNVEDPHAVDSIQNIWIGEFKEMAAMRKAELNAIKSFIERSEDNRRAAYERRAVKNKRHCVFVITVNDDQFLNDMTGNRRYMILHCNNDRLHYVKGLTPEYIDQIWAEVLIKFNEIFKDGFDETKLKLSYESQKEAEEIAQNYLRDDGMQGEVEAFLETKIPQSAIWNLLTRDERRKFFVDGYVKLIDGKADLLTRCKSRGGKNVDKLENEIIDILRDKDNIRFCDINHGNELIESVFIYGAEYRQHICAAEIFTECFGADKRKVMHRIHEILNNMSGWELGKRIDRDKAYGCQKKVFYRIPPDKHLS